jgi:hypothetical protein
MRAKVFLVIILLLFGSKAYTQVPISEFGKNRVQYKKFDWRFYSTQNFDIYFYDGGADIAKMSVEFLEEEFEKITDILGYAPYNKTKIFLYNSITDLQQSNVGMDNNNYSIGGQTNFVKSQVELAYPGTLQELKTELVYRIARMMVNDMMFGGSLSDMFQNSYLMTLPQWFIEGAALYVAYGWNVEMDDYMRDFFRNKKAKKLAKYEGKEAAFMGQSIWNYIAERYGRSNISNILNLTRIIRNEESSISNTLGVSFKQFLNDWQNSYVNMAEQLHADYSLPKKENRVRKWSRKEYGYKNVRINPAGQYLAYSENYRGKYIVKIRDLNRNRESKVLAGGYKVINQEINEDLPLLRWRDNTTLGIMMAKGGRNYIVIYDLNTKRSTRKEIGRFNQIKDFDFSPNGNVIVVSGDLNGQNDIFLISLVRNSIKRLTNDVFDDLNPRFIPNSTSVVFSSNRITDSLNHKNKSLKNINENYNLFIYNLDSTTNVLHRVTNNLSQDIKPVPYDENNIYYLSDQKGIFNIYRYRLDDNTFTQVSNYKVSLKDYDINFKTNLLTYYMLDRKSEYVFLEKDFDVDKYVFPSGTRRQDIKQARFLKNKLAEKKKQEEEKKRQDEEKKIALQDSISSNQNIEDLIVKSKTVETGYIDTDNYIFDRAVIQKNEEKTSFLLKYREQQEGKKVIGPLPYDTRTSIDNVITSWVIDPLRGFGIQVEAQMNDMLENHKFRGGLYQSARDLRSGNFWGEYQYLKNRVDFHTRFDRNVILREFPETMSIQKYSLNKIETGASLPLSVTTRLVFSPFAAVSNYVDLDPNVFNRGPGLRSSNINHYFGGFRAEMVFDNTLVNGFNLFEGTRGRIAFKHFAGLSDSERSFSNIQIDLRHYQKIHRELIFATRLFYGSFFGNNPQNYLLGGMDNWVFNRTEMSGPNDPLYTQTLVDNSNILFAEFVTNMRGFDYNKFNGSSAFLFNAELRFPFIKYFHRGPISSNFFRNFQVIGFYDVGSAWTGPTPVSPNSNLNTKVIKSQGSPFEARIKNFRSPWLVGYGWGMRTVLLGYYVKFDMAWPVEDYVVREPRFYLTLGYDF